MDKLLDEFMKCYWDTSFIPSYNVDVSYPSNVHFLKDGSAELIYALAGIKKEDISVNVDNNILTLFVNPKEDKRTDIDRVINHKISNRSMKCSWKLSGLDVDKIDVKFEDGLLTIKLPKAENTTSKSIKIK